MTLISEKLKQAKYATHMAGKWHGGAYVYGQLPAQRGFDSHLGYLNGMEDHWTQVFQQMKGVDLWLNDMPAFGMNGTYGGLMYVDHIVKAVEAHNTSDPLFLYMPFQNTHSPYEVIPIISITCNIHAYNILNYVHTYY
jgi:arylsulfatase A-like enzyme